MATGRFKHWSRRTTFHGFDDFCRTNDFRLKTLWAFVILASFAICCQQIYVACAAFITDKHWKSNLEVIYSPKGLKFPLVTICNMNRINRTRAELDYELTEENFRHIFEKENLAERIFQNRSYDQVTFNGKI